MNIAIALLLTLVGVYGLCFIGYVVFSEDARLSENKSASTLVIVITAALFACAFIAWSE